ncbi:MAG: response regulator [Candidatus Lokiarchaeia archaeon]
MQEKENTILLIDDDKSILRMFTRILQKVGYSVETAETGKEAIEKATARSYNLALIDIKLPDMEGTDLLPKLGEIAPKMIKITITGFPSSDDRVKALNGGASSYLVKPIQPEDLLKIIEENLKEQKES